GIDVERPPACKLPLGRSVSREHAIGKRDLLVGIGEHRKVRVLFRGKRLVVFEGVDTDHEVRSVVFPDESPALTERVALGRSTTRKRLWEPRQDDPPPTEILA